MEPPPAQTELPPATGVETPAPANPPDHLSHNLAALADVDAALADRLRKVNVAEHFERATGRDGQPTLRREHPDGSMTWLGRTSMPTVSGPTLLGNFDHTGGNIALHGLGQGMELTLLVRRIEPRQTVFVLEPDPAAVAGTLTMYDLAAAIRGRTVVLVVGDEPLQQLLGFLSENPGFDAPERFIMWPWQPQVEAGRFKSGLEDLNRAVERVRGEPLRSLAAKVRKFEPSAGAGLSRCLIISRRHDVTAQTATDDLVAAAASLGWETGLVSWHGPGRTSMQAHLAEIDRAAPQFVLLLNETRGQLGGLLPPGLPVASWFLEPRQTRALRPAAPGPADLILAESPATAARLIKAGIDPARTHILPAGASQPDAAGTDRRAESGSEWDVACFADGADLSPEALGIELSTLAAIWKALVKSVAREPEAAEPAAFERVLNQIAKQARLTDQQVRDDLLGRLEFDAAETILTRHYLKALLDSGVRVRLWGTGWQDDSALSKVWAGERPNREGVHEILSRSPVVLDCCLRERLGTVALTATLLGAVPVIRGQFSEGACGIPAAIRWPREYRPSELGISTYMKAGRLTKTVRDLIGDEDRRHGVAEGLRGKALSHHTAAVRLGTVARLMGERTGN